MESNGAALAALGRSKLHHLETMARLQLKSDRCN
jgi:hypothetical protein